jgi:hypothetical protein
VDKATTGGDDETADEETEDVLTAVNNAVDDERIVTRCKLKARRVDPWCRNVKFVGSQERLRHRNRG